MKEAVRRARPQDERPITEGCSILELSNSADDPELSIARARVPPGVTTRWHRVRNTAERYVIANTGPGDLVFLAIPASRRTPTRTSDRDFESGSDPDCGLQ